MVLVALFVAAQVFAGIWTDSLWFRSLGFESAWATTFWTKVLLAVGGVVITFSTLWLNFVATDRISPRVNFLSAGDEDEMVERLTGWLESRIRRLRIVVAATFAIPVGLGQMLVAMNLLRFFNYQPFGIVDPIYGNDVGFYIFRVPFIANLSSFFFSVLVLTLMTTVVLHYFNGAIRLEPGKPPIVTPGAKAHVSVLLAVLALIKAVEYRLDMYALLQSTRGRVVGASFTDDTSQRFALQLLMAIMVVVAVLLIINIWRRGWLLMGVSAVMWLAVSLLIGGVYPALIQQFRVQPDELNKELPYVASNIEFTRIAYGLSDIEIRQFEASQDLTAADLVANQSTVDNLRLWDPKVLEPTYKSSQVLAAFYQFGDVDVDRYVLDGVPTQVELAARELLPESDVSQNWVNRHLVFTHGFGAVVSRANEVTSEGKPAYLVKDIPPKSLTPELEISEPRIYYGESFVPGSFVIAGSSQPEVDRPDEGSQSIAMTSYAGSGGVLLDSWPKRAAFALHFSDFNTLISNQITTDSRMLMIPNVVERVSTAAPFLSVDSDPYLVVLSGRLVWVVDTYTTSSQFPYSEFADVGRLPAIQARGPYLPNQFNYISNSVKATVDAYDGTTSFYIVDDTDPLILSYQAIFPDMFSSMEDLPAGLEEHFRYPDDLFRVQSDIYKLYHETDPATFFTRSTPWAIAKDPSTSATAQIRTQIIVDTTNGEGVTTQTELREMMPYYLLLSLPDEEKLSFISMQPFTPLDKENMISFLVAKSDPGFYGDLIDYQLPRDRQFDGPSLVGQDINQDSDFSQLRTLLGQEGSDFIQGQMLVVPIEDSIIFVQPIYLAGEEGQIPEFKGVVVAYGNNIALEDTLDQALGVAFEGYVAGAAPTEVIEDLPKDVQEILENARDLYAGAETALAAGDLGTYQTKINQAAQLVEEALSALSE